MSKSKLTTAGKWLAIASVIATACYATFIWFSEPAFWLSLAGIAFVLTFSYIHAMLINEDFSGKDFFQAIKDARMHVEPNMQYDIMRIVAFAKLWFRKQFPVIDVELQRLKPSLIRLGLEAVREGYEESSIKNMMRRHAQHSLQDSVFFHRTLHSLSIHLPALTLLAAIAVLIPGLITNTHSLSVEHLLPAFITLGFGLALASLVLKPLLVKVERQITANDLALQVVIEGVLLIQHKRTPAMIRSTLEAVAHPQTDTAETDNISLFEKTPTVALSKRAS